MDDADIGACARKAALEVLEQAGNEDIGGKEGFASSALAAFSKAGLMRFGFLDPANSGPQPGDLDRATQAVSALAGNSGSLSAIYMLSGLLGPLCVSQGGTADQKAELLPRAANGTLQLSFAMTEPEAGSDAGSMLSQAIWDGEVFRLSGEKTYITGADTADYILTVAKTSQENPRAFGVFLVPRSAPGVTITPLSKLAGNAHSSCHIRLDNVLLPEDAVLGGRLAAESAWPTLRILGMQERLIVSFMSFGLASAATARAREFIVQRRQFGKTINSFQSVQHAVVEMSTMTEAMSLFATGALAQMERGEDGSVSVPMAKYFCSEQLQRVLALGVRVMGGRAYFDFEPMSRMYREAPFYLFAGGTVEIQKMLIARGLGI